MKWQRLFNDNRPQRKCVDPATIAAVGSLALNGVGSVMGATTAAENNEATRMWQTWMTKKNQDWSERMWNLNNEYNSPLNQRMLAEQAGYNPYLLGNDGNLGSGASLPSAPATPAAPNSLGPINPLQGFSQGLGSLAGLLQQQQQVDSNVDLQHTQGLLNLSKAAIDTYKEMGPQGFRQFMHQFEPVLESMNLDQSPMRQMVLLGIARADIAKESEDLTLQLRQRWEPQKVEREMEVLQNMPAKVVAETMKLSSSANLDNMQAYRVGSEVARNLAEAGYFNALGGQINTLLPYMKNQFVLTLGNMGIDFLNKEADFSFEEYLRDYKHTDKAKAARKRTFGMDSSVNLVGAFMDGFVSKIPSGLINAGLNTKNVQQKYEHSLY